MKLADKFHFFQESKAQDFLESFITVRFSPAWKNSLAPSVSLDEQDWRGGSVRSPDSQNIKLTGNQGSPNFNSVEIYKYWDRKKRIAGDDGQSCSPPCPLDLRSVLQDSQEILPTGFYEIRRLPS